MHKCVCCFKEFLAVNIVPLDGEYVVCKECYAHCPLAPEDQIKLTTWHDLDFIGWKGNKRCRMVVYNA